MLLRHYETAIILNAELPDERVEEILAKTREIIQNQEGEILHIDYWGRRRLSYEIKKQQRGNYVILSYKAATDVTRALEKFFRVTDDVIKFLNVRLEKDAVDALETRIANIEKANAAAEASTEEPPASTGTPEAAPAAPAAETSPAQESAE